MFIVRDEDALSRLDTARKLIKARDFWVYRDAQDAMAEAMRELLICQADEQPTINVQDTMPMGFA